MAIKIKIPSKDLWGPLLEVLGTKSVPKIYKDLNFEFITSVNSMTIRSDSDPGAAPIEISLPMVYSFMKKAVGYKAPQEHNMKVLYQGLMFLGIEMIRCKVESKDFLIAPPKTQLSGEAWEGLRDKITGIGQATIAAGKTKEHLAPLHESMKTFMTTHGTVLGFDGIWPVISNTLPVAEDPIGETTSSDITADTITSGTIQASGLKASAFKAGTTPQTKEEMNALIGGMSKVPLKKAEHLYQPVKSTSAGSTYYVVGIGTDFRIAARIKHHGTLSVRIEGALDQNMEAIKKADMNIHGNYASVHLSCPNGNGAISALAATLAPFASKLTTPMPVVEHLIGLGA